ncbi:transposase family protein (plasmid) [Streptomyces sp. NBC_01471]
MPCRGGARRRRPGAGANYELAFLERLVATLVHLRTGLTQEALAVAYGVGSSSTSRVINALRPLLAERGFAVPDRPDLRLRTLEDVFAYAEAEKTEPRQGPRCVGTPDAASTAPNRRCGVSAAAGFRG